MKDSQLLIYKKNSKRNIFSEIFLMLEISLAIFRNPSFFRGWFLMLALHWCPNCFLVSHEWWLWGFLSWLQLIQRLLLRLLSTSLSVLLFYLPTSQFEQQARLIRPFLLINRVRLLSFYILYCGDIFHKSPHPFFFIGLSGSRARRWDAIQCPV